MQPSPFKRAQPKPAEPAAEKARPITVGHTTDSAIVARLVERVDGLDEIMRGIARSYQQVSAAREDAMDLLGPAAPARLRRPPSIGFHRGAHRKGERAQQIVRLLRMNGPATTSEIHRWIELAWANTTKHAGKRFTTDACLKKRHDLFTRTDNGLWALREQIHAIDKVSDHGQAHGAHVLGVALGPRERPGHVAPDPARTNGDRLELGGGVPGPV